MKIAETLLIVNKINKSQALLVKKKKKKKKNYKKQIHNLILMQVYIYK